MVIEFDIGTKGSGLKSWDRSGESFVIPKLNRSSLMEQAQEVATWVKGYTGYDRVMVYRFDQENNGEVIAEAKEQILEPFLGLNYPASDIPAQARALYKLNWIRIIADVDGEQAGIYPDIRTGRKHIDMTHSMSRSVSPIHLQYLRNMEVKASLSVSIVINDRLWGLIACHHYAPLYLSMQKRLNLEVLGQSFSHQLGSKEAEERASRTFERNEALHELILRLSKKKTLQAALDKMGKDLLKLQDACGFVYFSRGKFIKVGDTPTNDQISRLIQESKQGDLQATKYSHRQKDLPFPSQDIAGYLLSWLSLDKADVGTLWFRKEKIHQINWGGKPKAPNLPKAERLSPRGSFELWQETVKGESQRWSEADVLVSEKFNTYFAFHVVNKLLEAEVTVKKLQEADKAKDQFLANISHELRTPLNSILGWSQIALNRSATSQDKEDALRVIQNNAQTQSQLIKDLLDYSQIITGNLKLDVQQVYLPDIVNSVCEGFAAAAIAKNIKLCRSSEGHSLSVIGDPIRVKQIIWNLVSNAIKFSPHDSSVEVRLAKTDRAVSISVQDYGRGLDRDEMDLVFERFKQLDKDHKKKGLGLGLAIVKQLIELHGGEVSASSEGRGRGTIFQVEFPTVPVAFVDSESPKVSIYDEDELGSGGEFENLNVLIVEDETDAASFLQKVLSLQGANVKTAGNGIEALNLLSSDPKQNLVISDIGMPEMDGYELIKSLRSSPRSEVSSIKAIALTAYSYPKDRIRALEHGFNSYISKPVSTEELFAVIKSVMPNQ